MPFPNTRVVPAGWSQHHARTAAGGMNGRCRIYDPATATPGWDNATESATLDWGTPVYDGPCRIQIQRGARTLVQGDEQIERVTYLVQLAFSAPVLATGWALVPYDCVNDSQLVAGQPLYITDTQLGTERFTRDLVCEYADR